jgi:hypothetical protein
VVSKAKRKFTVPNAMMEFLYATTGSSGRRAHFAVIE